MDNQQVLRLIKEVKSGPAGEEFVEYLKYLSTQNYYEFKTCHSDVNDVIKGKAIALDNLIKLFNQATDNIEHAGSNPVNAFD